MKQLLLILALITTTAYSQNKYVIKSAKPVVTVRDTIYLVDPNAVTRKAMDSVNKRLKDAEDALYAWSGSFSAMTKSLSDILTRIKPIEMDVKSLKAAPINSTTIEFPLSGTQPFMIVNDTTLRNRPWLFDPAFFDVRPTDTLIYITPKK